MLLRTRSRPRPVAGRYLLLEELGRGASGVVHRARDLRDGTEVAAKVLRGGDVDAVVRFVHESAHRISHPHVATPLGWAAEDDVVLIVMPLARGGSVRDLLATRGSLPPPVVGRLLRQLLDALVAVHGHDLVHGDVKPANLLLERAPPEPLHLLLGDFGVATSSHHPCPGVSGTPAFLAPERLAGAPAHPSQDVYAAGLVARRAITGSSPLLTLCDSMTRSEPERRPTAAAALRRLLELTGST
ncbi:MAG TPA: serine/threonine-protein kinase [Nocardioides sp.]|uniref:serine/threonine-protein kinase n=1 Tax=Nocardioides sp. TaxID=35761 RepID=UPI002E331893|nr:serine/threonine-protein kinase [Nocardioides sp.]HEX5087463.1 serine/threonine-protein kinase [Nocardioides sp.]